MVSTYAELIDGIISGRIGSRSDLQKAKIDACKKHGMTDLPTNSDILANAPRDPAIYEKLRDFLKLKPVRSLSGVVVVAVMSSPAPCPHGKCTYCPGGIENGSPQSYTGKEPAALRGAHSNFDPYQQTTARLTQLRAIGHPTDKVELIIMGGTFPARTIEYQEWFVMRCLDAMNGYDAKNLEDAQTANATAEFRCIGMTFETRPDWCGRVHIDHMLLLGATRVELGVQTIDDKILNLVGRGHGVRETIDATRVSKDTGLKVCYHMMPGLPGMTPENDLNGFREIFENPDFKPDMLKIYPTLVIRGTRLHYDWEAGKYEPYTTEQAAELLAKVKELIPKWIRIQRIQRDIPAFLIEAGVNKSHLRVVTKKKLYKSGGKCRCIRCREIGLASNLVGKNKSYGEYSERNADNIKLLCEKYSSSRGIEYFLSFDDIKNDLLIAYARLRFPSDDAHRLEVRENGASLLRELKVFGEMAEIDRKVHGIGKWQHHGYGKKLLEKCERLSKEMGYRMLLVNSGVGVKPYYGKLGYKAIGFYMGKNL